MYRKVILNDDDLIKSACIKQVTRSLYHNPTELRIHLARCILLPKEVKNYIRETSNTSFGDISRL